MQVQARHEHQEGREASDEITIYCRLRGFLGALNAASRAHKNGVGEELDTSSTAAHEPTAKAVEGGESGPRQAVSLGAGQPAEEAPEAEGVGAYR